MRRNAFLAAGDSMLLLLVLVSLLTRAAALTSPFNYGSASNNKATITSLEWFSSAKLGMFIHDGPVTQWGTEISFPLICTGLPCAVQGANKSTVNITTIAELKAHREAYERLGTTYNPSSFNATHIAQTAKAAGFQYVVYTTVHCDGFANWISNVTSYNIANSALQPPRDLFGELVLALRAASLRVGAYVCPTMWNDDNFVYPDHLTALNKNGAEFPTYDTRTQPERWTRYLDHMHAMATELATKYSPDLFWFDCHDTPDIMDTRLENLLGTIRAENPSSLVLTRNGVFSDYAELIDQSEAQAKAILGQPTIRAGTPFEIGTTLQASKQWAYDPTSKQKNTSIIISNLMMLSAKGGNYLINIPPGPTGVWAVGAENVLRDMSTWMEINGEALQHGAAPMEPYEIPCGTSVAYLMSREKVAGSGGGGGGGGGVVVYVLVPATTPSGEDVVAESPVRGQPTGAQSIRANDHDHGNAVDQLFVGKAISPIKCSGFRPDLMNSQLKMTRVELLGVPGEVVATQAWSGLTLDATKLLPSPVPSFLSNGVVYKLTFDEVIREL